VLSLPSSRIVRFCEGTLKVCVSAVLAASTSWPLLLVLSVACVLSAVRSSVTDWAVPVTVIGSMPV
jgi:hypothetical protein